jgi:hypothetical protein
MILVGLWIEDPWHSFSQKKRSPRGATIFAEQ